MLLRDAYLVQNGYDILRGIGLERIKSEPLRKHLITYYDVFTFLMKQAMQYDKEEFTNVLLPYMRTHFKDWQKDKYGFPKDFEQFKKDEYFLSTLKIALGNVELTIQEYQYGLIEIRSIPQLIDRYLEEN